MDKGSPLVCYNDNEEDDIKIIMMVVTEMMETRNILTVPGKRMCHPRWD